MFFTRSYPYGLAEMWKTHELTCLANYFDQITIIPFVRAGDYNQPPQLPGHIKSEQPLFSSQDLRVGKFTIFRLFDRNLTYYLREFFRNRVFTTKSRYVAWLVASVQLQQLLNHPTIRRIMTEIDQETVLYYYWGKGTCDIVPFVANSRKIAVRMHGYDLFEFRNNGYIPYRKPLLRGATIVAPSSLAGAEHIKRHYPNVGNVVAIRCGVISEGDALMSEDGVLRIITCSFLIPLKRIHLIIAGLKLLSFPIEWTHIGDGPLMKQLREQAQELPANIKVTWLGRVAPELVLSHFVGRKVDLFINVSETEGAPFSVMEALSASVPVIATDVGGTAETVDAEVGKLLPSDLTPEILAKAVTEFHDLPESSKAVMKRAAKERFATRCDASVLAREFAETLSE
jgi:glycosyltransferase involved in cell wall biosynthesis